MQFRNLINLRAAAMVASLAILSASAHANLIVNGDFEAGNSGFTSDYTHNAGNIFGAATYSVVSTPSSVHGSAANYGDHTSGTGLMMAVNGSTNVGNVVWSQVIDVDAGTDYDFAAYISSWTTGSPANLSFAIEGDVIGALVAPGTTGVWDLVFATWNSGALDSATISIRNGNNAFGGNDFALDDIYFGETIFSNPGQDPDPTPTPEPASMLLLTLGLAGFGMRKSRQRAR